MHSVRQDEGRVLPQGKHSLVVLGRKIEGIRSEAVECAPMIIERSSSSSQIKFFFLPFHKRGK